MGDPYWSYGVDRAPLTGGGGIPSFPGYLPSEASSLPIHPLWGSSDWRGTSSDFPHTDLLTSRPGAYGVDDIASLGSRPEPVIGGYTSSLHPEPVIGGYGAGLRPEPVIGGYPSSLDDPHLLGRRESTIGIGAGISDLVSERPESLRKADGLPATSRESNVLFVDGLPNDCSRREASHLFRPFIGFREIRVVHKEPRRTGDKAMVLCFVEFSDSKCALTALEALQGYKFDNKKPESAALKIHFAHFPFRLPSDREEPRLAAPL